MQTPAGMDASSFGAGSQVSAEGLDQVQAGVASAFDRQYQAIAAAVRSGDAAKVRQVVAASPMPAAAKAMVTLGATQAMRSQQAETAFLTQLHDQFQQQAKAVAADVTASIRKAFATAVTRVYRSLVVVVVLGFLVTLFIPVLTLRSSNDHAPVPTLD
jgi:uncharacterized SAM-dependent methyltransferase